VSKHPSKTLRQFIKKLTLEGGAGSWVTTFIATLFGPKIVGKEGDIKASIAASGLPVVAIDPAFDWIVNKWGGVELVTFFNSSRIRASER